jgi:hypothetical protein
MKGRWFAAALALGLIAAFWTVAAANSAGRPPCIVSNEHTPLGSRSLQEAIDAAAADDMLVFKGTCLGTSTIDKNLTLQGVSNKPFGIATQPHRVHGRRALQLRHAHAHRLDRE